MYSTVQILLRRSCQKIGCLINYGFFIPTLIKTSRESIAQTKENTLGVGGHI